MTAFSFKSYRPEDASAIIALWNSTELGEKYPLRGQLWRQQTEGDPDFEPDDLIPAYFQANLAGFVLIKRFRGRAISLDLHHYFEPYFKRGFIAAIAVAPQFQRQGLGTQLLQRAEARLQSLQTDQIWLGANMRHFFPGPPADLPHVEAFFSKAGYQFSGDQYDLRGSLKDWQAPATPPAITDGRYYCTQGQSGEETAILEFLGRAFPGRWFYETELFFQQGGSPEDITLLKSQAGTIEGFQMNYHSKNPIIGPSIYWSKLLEPNFGGVGPLGVSKEVRGLGLGLVLVASGLQYLQSRGVIDCVIDWTNLLEFYGKLNFYPWKHYRKAVKEIVGKA